MTHIFRGKRVKRSAKITGLTGAAVLLVGTGLFAWWNTDVLGSDSFCREGLPASEVDAVLSGKGRLTQRSEHEGEDPYGFSCTVQRTSKFIGAQQPKVEIELTSDSAAAPFQSRLWKNPGAMSYLKGKMAGGVSEKQAWILLPRECWSQVPARNGAVPAVTATVNGGTSSRKALAKLTASGAERVAKGLGCELQGAPKESLRFAEPVDEGTPRQSNQKSVCGLEGFTLPKAALPAGRAGLGTEVSTHPQSDTWACDLHLKGEGGPQITFSMSKSPDVVNGVQQDESAGGEREVLKCRKGDLYAGMSLNDGYVDALLDEYEYDKDDAYGKALKEMMSAFTGAAEERNGC